MKILHVLSTLNIGSGIANFVMSYYSKIVEFDIQFDFLLFCTVENGFEEEVEKLGGKVYYIAKPNLKSAWRYKNSIKRFFKEHSSEWECVHIHEILVQKYISKNAKRFGGVKKVAIHSHAAKFVLPEHGVSYIKNEIKMCFKKIRNAYLLQGVKRNSDYYLACSKDAGKALFGKKALKSDKFFVIKNAIDCKDYVFDEELRATYRDNFGLINKKVIALVGRLCEEKNQFFMLDVFSRIFELDKSYMLMLVGDGHLRAELESKTSEYGLSESVVFTGNRDDVKNILQASDLFVLPSLIEGLGIVLIEAQASGLPCIASTGVPECAKISPHFEFIELRKGIEYWANKILKTDLVRYDNSEYVNSSGYDIMSNIQTLVDIYKR